MRKQDKQLVTRQMSVMLLCLLLMQCASVAAQYTEITNLFASSKLIPQRLDSEDGEEDINPPENVPAEE